MKLLLSILVLLLLAGCSDKETIVYVDVNGTIIPKYEQLKVTPKIRCDSRGYAYYESSWTHGYSLTPILRNISGVGAYQALCKDL